MKTELDAPASAYAGGTVIAAFVTFVVIAVVSTVVAFLFGMMQFYMSSMRWEAAVVIGNIAGGVSSIYAARYACDATIKHYSIKSIFVTLSIMLAVLMVFQITRGLTQETLFRFALIIPMAITSWLVFWKDEL